MAVTGFKGALVAALGGRDSQRDDTLTGDEKIVQEARDRFKRCMDWEATARERSIADERFAEGDSDNRYQWDSQLYDKRTKSDRPALTINKTRQHNLQIVNDGRQNKAQIEIRPVGDGATYEAAKVFEGVVRHIEYISNAVDAYDTAGYHQVVGGFGYWRVTTDYIDDESFDQEIFIRRVPDRFSVFLDPDIQEFDGSDARFGFVFRDLPRDEAEREHPEIKDGDYGDIPLGDSGGWNDKDHVRVAEYYRKNEKSDTLLALADGTVVAKSKVPKEAITGDGGIGELVAVSNGWAPIVRTRKTTRPEVEWFKIVGDKIVERTIWKGKYIPIVRVIGEETVIDGQLDRKGHTRAMKDPQRMYNYWSSSAVEYGALQTKSPWIAPARAIEGHEVLWSSANRENHAVLPWNDVDDQGAAIAKPERPQAPSALPAAMEGMKVAQMELMMTSGQYQAQFGENENAKSGVAINARQRQGDNATYHFIEHQAKAIRFTGRILIDLIPKIYDTPRVIKIIAENGDESEVHVQPGAGQPHQMLIGDQPASEDQVKAAQANPDMADKVRAIFDPNVGRYEVQADIGPSYGTKRQEAFAAFSQIMSQNAEAFKIGGDIMFRAADFPGADELAERLKRAIPAPILGEGEPPEVAQVKAEAQQHLQGMQQIMQQLVQDNADKDLKLKQQDGKIDLEGYKAETQRLGVLATADPEAFKPYARAIITEALGQPVVPLMAAHAHAERLHGLGTDTEETGEAGEAPEAAEPAPPEPSQTDMLLQELVGKIDQLATAKSGPKELVYENGVVVGANTPEGFVPLERDAKGRPVRIGEPQA